MFSLDMTESVMIFFFVDFACGFCLKLSREDFPRDSSDIVW